jgi:hypothetical protein
MGHLDIDRFRAAELETRPFEYAIVPRFLKSDSLRAINATFPEITRGGSFPVGTLDPATPLKEVIDELDGPEFEVTVSEKFGVSLAGKPKMYSLRGYLRSRDGKIHTDTKDKIITVLLYLNERWEAAGGRLRLLRDGTDLENYAAEVAPDNGTLLVFKRAENSWHGHYPYEGQRRALQMNWMTNDGSKHFHAVRHKISAVLKSLTAAR